MSVPAAAERPTRETVRARLRANAFVRGPLGSRSGIAAVAMLAFLVALTVLGPLFAPHSTTETVGIPLAGPSGAHPFGTDSLGRDALSRFLAGGRTLLAVAFIASWIPARRAAAVHPAESLQSQ